MAKNDPLIHKPYTLCVRCVLRGEFCSALIPPHQLFRAVLLFPFAPHSAIVRRIGKRIANGGFGSLKRDRTIFICFKLTNIIY